MKRPLILVGGGGHCKSVIEVAESTGYEIKGILDVPDEVGKEILPGHQVIGTDDKIPQYIKECDFVITVGFIKNPVLRIKLYNKVKKASFDDNKFDLIEVASLGCYYSCAQVVRIMKIFSFDDSKMKVLSMMAPRIVDLQNAIIIYQQFNFESEKQKVGEILRSSR